MIVPDANLLLYAYDSSSPFHQACKRWWSACLGGDETVGLTHPVLFAFLRIATHPRVYTDPMSLGEATGHIRSWLERGSVRELLPDHNHSGQVLALLKLAGAAGGNLVTDSQIAALAIAHGATVHTADRDFLRFKPLHCHFPLDVE